MDKKGKLCVWWQGRKASTGSPVKRFGVYQKCMPIAQLNRAIAMTKAIAKRRSGGAALSLDSHGGSSTLITCKGTRCRTTALGSRLRLSTKTKG